MQRETLWQGRLASSHTGNDGKLGKDQQNVICVVGAGDFAAVEAVTDDLERVSLVGASEDEEERGQKKG